MPETITAAALEQLLQSEALYALIDVRERVEYENGQILGATQIPRRLLETHLPVLVPDKRTKIVLYSGGEGRAALAARTLERAGYGSVSVLAGGLAGWQAGGLPTVRGVHVLSKAFGEIVGELQHAVTPITPQALKKRLDADAAGHIVVDVRPTEEVAQTGSIPGACNIPGVELPLKLDDLLRTGKTVVLTCAGRTRGFIAAATVGRLGLGRVFDLQNGTLGWRLAGYALGQSIPTGQAPSPESRARADALAVRLAEEAHIPFLTPAELKERLERSDGRRPIVLDVRQPDAYARDGHIPGARPFPGGQAVQNVDDAAVAHNAGLVFTCDNGTRAVLTAYWYLQMGIPGVSVLRGGTHDWAKAGFALETGGFRSPAPLLYEDAEKAASFVDAVDARALLAGARRPLLFDVGDGRAFAAGHLSGARWLPRGRLEERAPVEAPERAAPILLCSTDAREAVFASAALGEMGYRGVRVLKGGSAAWAAAGLPLVTGADGFALDDWQVRLTEYDLEEAKRYFEWEESLTHLQPYMAYFKLRGLFPTA